jgi:acyl-CoA synthetase (AMP-forming)/AMP-acid ligase II
MALAMYDGFSIVSHRTPADRSTMNTPVPPDVSQPDTSMEAGSASVPYSAKTLPQLIRTASAAYGDAIAVTYRGDPVREEALSFKELDSRSAQLARGLIAHGAGKGTRVGFIYGNRPTFVLLMAAIGRIGGIAIPISTLVRGNELVRVLRQSDVSGLILQRSFLGTDYVERLCEALPALRKETDPHLRIVQAPFLRWIASSGPDLPPTFRDIGFLDRLASSVSEELLRALESEIHPTDQLLEIYTSGSMALPKGVRHNHGPVLFRTHYLRSMINPQRGKQIVVQLPLFWVGGLMMYVFPNWEAGAASVCVDKTLSDSRFAMGSVMATADLKLLAQAKTYWALGMSETLGPYSYSDVVRAPGYPLCAPLDHIAERYEVRVADENDKPVADGQTGEIQVRGYALTPGLHKVERDDCFTADGYYCTGDMGRLEGSRINFVGRNGDMIKTAGANVSPAEVEAEMQALDGVHSAYVVGIPDKERGQLVVAAVVPHEGVTLDFDRVQEELRARLSAYKVPRAYLSVTRDQVPLLHSNKVARRQLEAMLAMHFTRDP